MELATPESAVRHVSVFLFVALADVNYIFCYKWIKPVNYLQPLYSDAFSIHIDAITMRLPIVLFKGNFFLNYDLFLTQKVMF